MVVDVNVYAVISEEKIRAFHSVAKERWRAQKQSNVVLDIEGISIEWNPMRLQPLSQRRDRESVEAIWRERFGSV